jgi:uncharacterized protein YbjQ (UPF0145 family)
VGHDVAMPFFSAPIYSNKIVGGGKMKNHILRISPYHMFSICSLLLVAGCHGASVTRFGHTHYPRTSSVKVYSDIAAVTEDYFEIGYVEAKGGITVSKQTLLDDMIQQAREAGAHALIKVEFCDRQYYNPNIGSFEKPAAKAVMIRFRPLGIQDEISSNAKTIESPRSETSMLQKRNEEANKTLQELQDKLAAYQTAERDAARQQLDSSVYAGIGSGHWITENMNTGEFIKLEDGSLWQISPFDKIHAALWLPVSRIIVLEGRNPICPYILINSDDGEKVDAKLIAGIAINKGDAQQDASNSLIESRIDGDFEGWDGDTIFKLMNGQIWQQVSYDYTYHYAFMPNVLIYRANGGYKMKVDGVQKSISVKRLK